MPSTAAARAVVAALVAAGVRDVVLAPGSRSAPLAYALHAAERAGWLNLHVRVDERSAGFVALGIARVRAAAVVTTSGTAVANLHPAVLEASHSDLPLVVLSADRPHELRGVGANQTTDQVGLFGSATRWAGEIPADDAVGDRGVSVTITRAVAAARGLRTGRPGPVHVNVAFRDPLTPDDEWTPGAVPTGSTRVAEVRGAAGSEVLVRGPRTVVVAGDAAGPEAARVAAAGAWPLLAEPSSAVRGAAGAVAAYRLVLDRLGPQIERVVVLGRPTLTRPVSALLARTDLDIVVVDPDGGPWVDVAGAARAVVPGVTVPGSPSEGERAWAARWQLASDAAAQGLSARFDGAPLSGPSVARAVLGSGGASLGAVVLGSSMAVRDADLAAPVGESYVSAPVVANRGLAGIDGTISTAVGLALALDAPVRALLGDLTFQHDVGGLARGTLEREVDLQVIVLNDDGGAIFATLEHGRPEHAAVFTRVFGTPQGVDVRALAAGFCAAHRFVGSAEELAAVLAEPIVGRSVVEVALDGSRARADEAALAEHVLAAVRARLGD